jgi:hypothetical protein
MGDFDTLALFARNDLTRTGLRDAAERRGLTVISLSPDPQSIERAAGSGVAFRAPGGLMAQALGLGLGTTVRLFGPTAEWFVALGAAITGRSWSRVTAVEARAMLGSGPVFIKLADAKRRDIPARRYPDVATFDSVTASLDGVEQWELLATTGWLDIDSEYRVFTRGRDVLTTSPYWVQDEPWTPLLYTHRASFHLEAAQWVRDLLAALPGDDVPPAAVLDVARLSDGRLVLLEANQCWGSGLYGCDPHAALDAILTANNAGHDERWLWRPDQAATPKNAHPS